MTSNVLPFLTNPLVGELLPKIAPASPEHAAFLLVVHYSRLEHLYEFWPSKLRIADVRGRPGASKAGGAGGGGRGTRGGGRGPGDVRPEAGKLTESQWEARAETEVLTEAQVEREAEAEADHHAYGRDHHNPIRNRRRRRGTGKCRR
ncbi:hypothetical protein DL764_004909 [Monosporascus ibericus]|uniref:Uncharacterized protein n=1 Tax=Monosporascus ibericus TaxID=155417 RepID=A0A4Q4TEG6_9PEZI|nr:hypothetical protein DL764_004909 [Monosporascus ibericus]